MHAVVELPEDHFSGGGLQHAGDRDVDGFRDHALGIVDHHHGTVIQVSHALVVLLAFLQNKHAHGLARQHNRLQRVRQLIDIQNLDAMQLCDFIQIEVVGDDLAIVDLGQLDQLHVHLANVGKVIFHNLHVEVRHFLDTLQDVEASPAAIALHGVRRIGHKLQLAEHKLRYHQHAVEKTGLGDVGNAAIDDDAGVQNLEGFFQTLFAAEHTAQGGQVQHVALVGPHHQANIGHPEHQEDLQKVDGCGVFDVHARQHQTHQKRAENAEYGTERRSYQPLQADLFYPDLE